MCVESNSGVADPAAAAARPGTRVVEWLCVEFPDYSLRKVSVRQEGNLGSGYKNTDLKWSQKRIELSPEVIVQVH